MNDDLYSMIENKAISMRLNLESLIDLLYALEKKIEQDEIEIDNLKNGGRK